MRHAAALLLGLGLTFAASGAAGAMPMAPHTSTSLPLTKVEYFCSPGYEPSYGGRCIATAARDQVELFVDTPVEAYTHVTRRRHGLRERY